MPAARLGSRHCTYCCRPEAEVGKLSGRGNCRECGIEAAVSNVVQQQAKSGPWYEHNARRRLAAAERDLTRNSAAAAA